MYSGRVSKLMFYWIVGRAGVGDGALHLLGSKASSAQTESFSGDTR